MDTEDRKQRAEQQPIAILDCVLKDDVLTFYVRGMTHDYTIKVHSTGTECTCPDYASRRGPLPCKHIIRVLYVFLRLDFAMDAPVVLSPEKRVEAFRRFKDLRRGITAMATSLSVASRENDDCSICFDTISPKSRTKYCTVMCGNRFHEECIKLWLNGKRGDSKTCPMCRSVWQ